jgi:integrase
MIQDLDVKTELEHWIIRKSKKIKNANIYNVLLKDLKELYPKRPLYFREINFDFKNKVVDFWLSKKPRIQNATVNKRMNCLKIFLKEMVEDGKTVNLLFKQFRTGVTGIRKHSVIIPTIEEFKTICNAKIDDQRLSYARDIWILAASTGLRFSDTIKINKNNVQIEKGKNYIITNIQKTVEAQHRIPLNNVGLHILTKYPQGMRKISNQKINKALYDLFKSLKINTIVTRLKKYGAEVVEDTGPKYKFLTFHSSRRFFISFCVNDGKIGLGNVMAFTAHKNVNSIDTYIQKGYGEEDKMRNLFKGIIDEDIPT